MFSQKLNSQRKHIWSLLIEKGEEKMKSKKIALISSILMATLVVGVYAVVLSNTLTTTWTLEDSTNLNLYWSDSAGNLVGAPTGFYRGVWKDGIYIGLETTGDTGYASVIGKFEIWASGYPDISGKVTIEYWGLEGGSWGWYGITLSGTTTLTGSFGPASGFPVTYPYKVWTQYRILFENDAPLGSYGFNAWVETV